MTLTLTGGAAAATLIILVVAIGLCLSRLARGPYASDRVVALDLIGTAVTGAVATFAFLTDQPAFLDAAVVLALISFLGTVAYARYVEKGARQ